MSLSIAQSFQVQYDALHGSAVVIDRSQTDARLEVTGADRVEWLQGLLTNDVAALAPGQGCYAAYLTPQGRMIGDMRVLHLGDRVILDVPAAARATLLSRLDQFIIMEDVVLADRTDELSCVCVAGPRAAAVLGQLGGVAPEALEGLSEHHHLPARFADVDAFCAASREYGVAGFDVYLPAAAAARLLQMLAEAHVHAIDEAVAETARIEAGRPRFGVDMHEDTIPLEAGIEHRAVSLTKGCYVGQEVIIRVLHRGQGRVARRLCLVVSSADAEAWPTEGGWRAGAELVANGKAVGRLTSVCVSPRRGRWLAIGLVHRDAAVPGMSVDVVDAGVWQEASIEALIQA